MLDGTALLDRQYFVMRERILSLAADLDRIERAPGGVAALKSPKAGELLECIAALGGSNRAETVQRLLSDVSEGPTK